MGEFTLESILPHIRLKYLKIGEFLLGNNTLPCTILIEGQLRQHVNHPESNKRLTLDIHKYPYIAGLASYHANLPLEFTTAASDCILIELDVERIDSLSNIVKFTDLLSQSFSTSDLWPLLSSLYKSSVPSTSRDIQTWIKSYISHSRQHFFKEGSSLDIDLNENDIFINSAIHQQFKYSQQLTLDNLRSLKSTDLSSKLRIIQIKKSKVILTILFLTSILQLARVLKQGKDPAINTTQRRSPKIKTMRIHLSF